MNLSKTIAAVKAEIARRRASGESAPDADVADFEFLPPLEHDDGTLSLRSIFTLTDGSRFAMDSVERFERGSNGQAEVIDMIAVEYDPSDFRMH